MGWFAWELSGLVLAEAFVITLSKVILKAKETITKTTQQVIKKAT